MELEQPNTNDQVNDQLHYSRGSYYVLANNGKLVRVFRHMARVRLICRFGLSRQEAERKLNEVKDYYISHPDAAFQIKRRYVRDSTNLPLTEDELTEVALHGWRKYRERDLKRWRTATSAQMTEDGQ